MGRLCPIAAASLRDTEPAAFAEPIGVFELAEPVGIAGTIEPVGIAGTIAPVGTPRAPAPWMGG